jgi:hypothetical protein
LEGGAVSLPGHGAFFGILEPAPVEKTPRQLQPAQ